MSIHWSIERVRQLAEKRSKQHKCTRCGLFYFKTEDNCPHCSALPDYKVKLLLKKRSKERSTLGMLMFLAMALLMLFLYFINT